MAAMSALSREQTHALFDILTHSETYHETEGFKFSDAVINYGFPFSRTMRAPAAGGLTTTPQGTAPSTPRVRTPAPPSEGGSGGGHGEEEEEEDDSEIPPSSPLLQMLLTRFVLPLPGVRDLPRDFWRIRIQGLVARLGDAELSESYDKGALGTRKTLATGFSAVVEMLGRGALGGVERAPGGGNGAKDSYDSTSADDLIAAWEDSMQRLVYGNLVDELFEHFAKTADLEAHSPAVKAAVEYSIFHLATFSHRIFILSPEGQYLLKLMENVHGLIPYKMVKQTLRVGNAATMISGMMRLLLAKLSVTSVTNWFGLTANADDGMNLLQRIISMVLSWDSSEFKKGSEKIEKGKGPDAPSEEMLKAIRQHIAASRKEHELVRETSLTHSQSIITAIFNASNPSLNATLSEAQHAQCLEYYSALLSVRDREAITTAFCKQPPDLFTRTIKDSVAAYDPIIRTVHAHVDLKEHLESMQGFIEDFIRASKPKKAGADGEQRVASVEDYVKLLMANRGLLYKWIHALASGCPELWEELRLWAAESVKNFQQGVVEGASREEAKGGDGDDETTGEAKSNNISLMDARLGELFASLDASTQKPVLAAIDAHAEHLSTLSAISYARLQYLAASGDDSASGTNAGPGIYLARWDSLLDETPITPSAAEGQGVRHGRDVKHTTTMGKTGVSGGAASAGDDKRQKEAAVEGPPAPDVGVVVRELGVQFRDVVCEMRKR